MNCEFGLALNDLAAVCCNTIGPHCQGVLRFTRLTVPTIHQQKMVEILGVKLQVSCNVPSIVKHGI